MKKYFSCLLVLLAVLMLPMLVTEAEAATVVDSGTCGENVTWTLDSEGTLTISGSGTMEDYASASDVPWYSQRTSIVSIVVEDGITTIGDRAFYNCTALVDVTIADSVTTIGTFAFRGCTALEAVEIPAGVTEVKASAFRACTALTEITFGGNGPQMGDYVFNDGVGSLTVKYYEGSTGFDGDFWADYSISPQHVGQWVVDPKPTCITDGSRSVYCTYCQETFTETLPGGHNYVDGRCSVCEELEILASGTCGDNLQWKLDGTGLLTISGTGPMNSFFLDSFVPWYGHRDLITTVIVEDGVTSIGRYAFSLYTSLNSITIPSSVTYIGEDAFWRCTSLSKVEIADIAAWCQIDFWGASSNPLAYASNGLYVNGESITEVVIPEGVTSIGDWAFSECESLSSVVIPESITSVGSCAFFYCEGLTKVEITDIDAWCQINFEDAYSNPLHYASKGLYVNGEPITEAVIPESVTSIPYYAFRNCTGLRSITIPDSVTGIGSSAFKNCTGLRSIAIPDSVTSIGSSVFENCTGLRSITIPDGVTGIDSYAFRNCTGLRSITIPDSVTSIGSSAFYNCDSLSSVILSENLTSIGSSAFYNCNSLSSITIPDSVTTIGSSAFYNCDNLNSITIPDIVTSIGSSAFYDCDRLSSIIIPASVTNIGDYAFYGCDSLERVEITDIAAWCGISFGSAYSNPLYYADNGLYLNGEPITEVVLPDSVTSIYNCAFRNCKNLTSVTIPDSVTSIGYAAFSGCSGLESMTIPFVGGSAKTEEDTYQYPFGYIFGEDSYTGGTATTQYYYGYSTSSTTYDTYYIPSSLKSVTITGGNILYGAFENCGNLTNITLPEGITSIGDSAFYNCDGLSSITIPESVTTIGRYAFYDCDSLNGIWVDEANSNYSSDDRGVLFNKDKTQLILAPGGISGAYSIPDSVTGISEGALAGCTSLNGIWVDDENPSYSSDERGVLFDKNKTQLIQAPGGITGAYSISEGVTSISNYAFWNCASLSSITIPDSVTSIDEGAFSGCSGLESMTIPFVGGSIKTEDDDYQYPFGYIFGEYNYTGGTETTQYYYYSTSSTTYDTYYIPSSLKSVTITGGNILYGAFENCGNLTSITLPDSVTSIGRYAFYSCDSLSSITIPEGLTSIGNSVFYNCDGLSSITIPESLTSIGEDAFYSCDSLAVVHYGGTRSQESEMSIGLSNWDLYSAEWHYGCDGTNCPGLPPEEETEPEEIWPEETEPEVTEPDEIGPSPDCEFYLEGYVGDIFSVDLTSSYSYDYVLTGENSEYVSATLTGMSSIVIGSYGTYCQGYDLVFSQPGFYELTFVQQVTGNTVYFEANISPKPVIDNPFGDVAEDAYYFDPVLWAVDNGITNGLSEDSFGPEATCTRGQIVTFLWRACGSPEPKMAFNPFSDVSSSDYFYKAVLWAVENGITSGMGDGTFAPNAGCTRGQVATFLWRSQGQPYSYGENIFDDIAPGAYYYDAVLWAVEEGITNGMGEGLFAPDATCTRGQIVTFLYRAMA